MLPILIVSGVCVTMYGMFLMIRGLVRVYKLKDMKMFYSALAFLILDPLLLTLFILLVKQYDLWLFLPVLILAGSWICMGYFFESWLRKDRERRANGLKRVLPQPKPGQIRKDLILLAVALLLWVAGACGLLSFNPTLETCGVCICFFLLASSAADLWKYRGF